MASFFRYQALPCTLTISPLSPFYLLYTSFSPTTTEEEVCMVLCNGCIFSVSLMAADSICFSPTSIHRVWVEGQSVLVSTQTFLSDWLPETGRHKEMFSPNKIVLSCFTDTEQCVSLGSPFSFILLPAVVKLCFALLDFKQLSCRAQWIYQ